MHVRFLPRTIPMMSSQSTAPTAAARLGLTYGYRLDADSVELNACIQLLHDSAHQLQWALQLHASPADNTTPFPQATHLIAEAQLPPISEMTGANESFALVTAATPPAGNAAYYLTLYLVARQPGQTYEIHDVAHFARPERFIQPRLNGAIACNFSENEVRLSLDAIENPRASDNVSGTLSLELWALTTPYTGGAFQGMPLAGAILGRLSGQESWYCPAYTLNYAAPTAGQWNVALMLREWTGSGYTTRDFRNLSEPLLIANPVVATPVAEVAAPTAAPVLAPKASAATTKSKPAAKKASAKPSKPAAKATTKLDIAPASRTSRSKKSGK
jgi:hypothetical protein